MNYDATLHIPSASWSEPLEKLIQMTFARMVKVPRYLLRSSRPFVVLVQGMPGNKVTFHRVGTDLAYSIIGRSGTTETTVFRYTA